MSLTLCWAHIARVAQSVEHGTLNPRVVGSSPTSGASLLRINSSSGEKCLLQHVALTRVTFLLLTHHTFKVHPCRVSSVQLGGMAKIGKTLQCQCSYSSKINNTYFIDRILLLVRSCLPSNIDWTILNHRIKHIPSSLSLASQGVPMSLRFCEFFNDIFFSNECRRKLQTELNPNPIHRKCLQLHCCTAGCIEIADTRDFENR